MARLTEVSSSRSAEEFLRRALESETPRERARHARAGLAVAGAPIEPQTRVLLLRQLYTAYLDSRRFRQAADVALEMAQVGPLRDVAHHDASRALMALGETDDAIAQQRLAARVAPADRRSFQYWSLATLLQHSGDLDGAAAALERGERWSHADRPLIRAHRAWVRLENGEAVRRVDEVLGELERAACHEGYGQLVLGMLYLHIGDERRAAVHLRAFLRRNASADVGKATTLREEMRRARLALARIESD